MPRSCPTAPILAILLLGLSLSACGDDDPAGPGNDAPVTETITVSLDQIAIQRDCDPGSGGDGEFSYKFYVTTMVDGEETTYLGTDYSSFSASDGQAWDPGVETTFTLERRAGVQFRVRAVLRELDGSFETMRGYSIRHAGDAPGAPWQPEPIGSQFDGYSLYDAQQRIGEVDVEFDQGADCQASFTYTVSMAPASSVR